MTRAALGLLVLAAACRPDCTPLGGDPAPIVLLVTIDTLRADHLGSYGSARVQTPNLDRLGAEGVRFANVWSAASITIPSHTSLFLSQPLARHGVVSNQARQAPAGDTVQGLFHSAGYRTAAFVSAYHLGPAMLFGSLLPMLQPFDAPELAAKPRVAADTVDHTLAWLKGACRTRTFAWIHLWDPHMPYTPPSPFDRAYYRGDPRDPRNTSLADVEYDWVLRDVTGMRARLGRHASVIRLLKTRLGIGTRAARRLVLHPNELRQAAPDPHTYALLDAAVFPVYRHLQRTLPFSRHFAGFLEGVRDVEYPRALYAGEVSYVDRELGRLVDTLTAWGLRDRMLVLVTADHGEGLGDHGIYFNHEGLWEPMLRVPLIVWAPGRVAPGVRADPASGLDVAPTLLELARIPFPSSMEGRDLLADGVTVRPVVAEGAARTQIAFIDRGWKLVRTLSGFFVVSAFQRDAGDVELYDLAHDPEERRNVAAIETDRLADLSARLDAWLTAHGRRPDGKDALPAAPPLTPAERDRLRALGYVE
jgi:arylsulfatase A-like enzyme